MLSKKYRQSVLGTAERGVIIGNIACQFCVVMSLQARVSCSLTALEEPGDPRQGRHRVVPSHVAQARKIVPCQLSLPAPDGSVFVAIPTLKKSINNQADDFLKQNQTNRTDTRKQHPAVCDSRLGPTNHNQWRAFTVPTLPLIYF